MNYSIITFGCQMNVADSQWIIKTLENRGYTESAVADADLVLVNTCSVREKPEHKVRSTLGRILRETDGNPKVLVGVLGCVAQQLGENLFSFSPQVRLVAGTDATGSVPDAVEMLERKPGSTLCLTAFSDRYEERAIPEGPYMGLLAYVNIMQGCDNFCSYCIVPFTRGRQKSRSSKAVLEECARAIEGGAKEITLLGQNVNAYGKDKTGDGTSFASLVKSVAALDAGVRIRYVTPHPKDMTEEDVAAFAEIPNLCPRLHLPMQAGSDTVLKRMRRRYDGAGFLDLVERLKKARSDLALSTDIIVGFPGETEEDFLKTMDMVKACGFMSSFSFCYSDRPGARATTFLDKIAPDVQLDRLQRVQALQEEMAQAFLDERQGKTAEVLFEGESPRQQGEGADGELKTTSFQGRDPYGVLVHVPFEKGANPMGQTHLVRVTKAFKHSLQGELVKP